MTCKNVKHFAVLCILSVLAVMSLDLSATYAEVSEGYNMVGDVTPVLTFTFRDGVEVHEFPVFKMGEDLVSNAGTTFSVEGVIEDSPLLHKALDDAYWYRNVSGRGTEFQYKYFDVTVDFVKGGESILTLDYANCQIANNKVKTISSGDYESYFKKLGFAILDIIDFRCGGVNPDIDETYSRAVTRSDAGVISSNFDFSHDVRPVVTFEFDDGVEKIEFPVFNLVHGFEETSTVDGIIVQTVPEFTLEGIVSYYPLLYKAVDRAIHTSGLGSSFNTDFEATVKFTNGEKVLRGFVFNDCRVSSMKITTQLDKEEGFTGKTGFAVVHQIGFLCAGLVPTNPSYNSLSGDVPIWDRASLESVYSESLSNNVGDVRTVATFKYSDGIEKSDFTLFAQPNVLDVTEDVFITTKTNTNQSEFFQKTALPTFELEGVVGDYPMLYKAIDDNRKIHTVSGTGLRTLFDVDVALMNGDHVIRELDYSGCRPIDYKIETGTNAEESYVKNKFAEVSTVTFECRGYHPVNPVYETMYGTYDKADTVSSNDLRVTQNWGPNFK